MNRLRVVFLMTRKSLRHHRLSTTVTVAIVGLAAGLVMSVFALSHQSELAFTGGDLGFDAVVGARGSKLQLVLNAVYHLETSPGNIPWSLYTAIRDDPRVARALPYAVGDNFRGYRIVGTTIEVFDAFQFRRGETFHVRAGGRVFDPARREAVLGSRVADATGLRVGSTFEPYHGITFDPAAKHTETYEVVGILETTNTAADRVVWIPIEGMFRLDGHVLRGSGERYVPTEGVEIPDEHKEVSAILVRFRTPQAGFVFDQMINRQGDAATLAWPIGVVMSELFDKMGWVNRILEIVAYLVVLVSMGAILASLYNTMNERRREFAIIRALGAHRATLVGAVIAESTVIAALGAVSSFFVHGAIGAIVAAVVRRETGVEVELFAVHPAHWATPLGVIVVGALAGIAPAVRAYAVDVAASLVPQT